jgi:hypothetical protein
MALVRDGEVAGYGVIRRCREGYKIGPLFADDAAIYIDPPVTNAAAIALAESHGLAPSFETARM